MNSTTLLPAAADAPWTLASLLVILTRRRALLLWPLLAFSIAAALGCLLAMPRYRAEAVIQVQKDDPALTAGSSVTGQAAINASGDSLDYNMTLQTEAGMLRAPALALAVIQAAQLETTPDYFAPATKSGWHPFAWLAPHAPLEPLAVPLAQAPVRRAVAEKIFKAHLKVEPVAGTRLITIAYTDPNPTRAALVANTITHVLSDMLFQQSFAASSQASAWLAGQLDDLRRRAEQATARAATLERGTGVFGADASRNVVLERLDSLNQTLTAAEGNRLLKESIDRVAAGASPELISSLSGNSSTGSVASINTSLSLLQGMRQQEAQLRSDLSEANSRYGPAYPRVTELNAQLSQLTASIAAETARLGQRAHTDWLVAVRQEAGARQAFEKQKQLATRQNDSVIAYQLARQEADNSRELYEGLLSRLKQTSLLEGLRASNVSVVSPALVPSPRTPASPNVPLWLAMGVAAGFGVGAVAVTWVELTDASIQSLEQLEDALGLSLLAVLPTFSRPVRQPLRWPGMQASARRLLPQSLQRKQPGEHLALPVLEQRLSHFAEALRSLRASLQLGAAAPRVLLITGCTGAEGKSTIAVNLSILFAQDGARVLLVDADMRRPRLFQLDRRVDSSGLAMALSGPAASRPAPCLDALPNLHLLSSREVPPLPAELLGSSRMQGLLDEWRSAYDLIVLDAPAALPSSDARLLARHSDAVLLVARHRVTTTQALRRSVQTMGAQAQPRAPLGVVLNDVARDAGDFRRYFGYRGGAHARTHTI